VDADALPERQKALLRGLARTVGENADKLGSEKLAGFVAMVGRKYLASRELMIVGRATNGWGWKGFVAGELTSPDNVEEFVKDALDISTRGPLPGLACPMLWVTQPDHDYKTASSAFWRVARRILIELGAVHDEDEEWPSYLAWSNAYRIAPQKGGNPSTELCRVQFDNCVELLNTELAALQPKRLLVMSSTAWPFVERLTARMSGANGYEYVKSFCKIVFSRHPERTNEGKFVDEVVRAFSEGLSNDGG
jgi:hypothetical protein